MKRVSLNVIITSIRAKVDGSLGFSVSTPELSPDEKALFMTLQGNNLMALFTPLDEPNAPEYVVDKEIETKSPSSRLRNTLYVY